MTFMGLVLLAGIPVDGGVEAGIRAVLEVRPNRVVVIPEAGEGWAFPLPPGNPTHLALSGGRVWVVDPARGVLEAYDLNGNRWRSKPLPPGIRVREMTPVLERVVLLGDRGIYWGGYGDSLVLGDLEEPRDLLWVNGEWWVIHRTFGAFSARMWLHVYDENGTLLRAVLLPPEVVVGVDMQYDPQDSVLTLLDAARLEIFYIHAYTGALLARDSLGVGGNVRLLPSWRGTRWVISLGASRGIFPLDSVVVQREEFPHAPPEALRYTLRPRMLEVSVPSGEVRVVDLLGREVTRHAFRQPARVAIPLRPGHYWLFWTIGTRVHRVRVVMP